MVIIPAAPLSDSGDVCLTASGPGSPAGTVTYLAVGSEDGFSYLDEKGVRDLIAALEDMLPPASVAYVDAKNLKPGMVLAAGLDRVVSADPEGRDISVTLESGFTQTYIPTLPFSVLASSIR